MGCLILVSRFGALKVDAATAADSSRPRIGLALGGGSALGFTHVGVLQWLEENHIPVDAVAGTSMGGLMGGLYALGMSPKEIALFVKGIDWNHIFDSAPPYYALDFRRKEDRFEYPIQEIGLRHKLIIPNGLSLYRVSLLLSRITLPYSNIGSFDELPTPYRSVATDIRNSEPYIFKDGSLAEAMRATMAVPGVFTPVQRDDRLLVDGGLVDNVPADVVKNMGADVVIAVNCNQDNHNQTSTGVDSVLMSSVNTVINENTRRALELANIVIHPEIADFSFMDWNKIDQFIRAGYQAAARQAADLKKLAVDEKTWQAYLRGRAERRRTLTAVPEAIEVRGTNEANRKAIQKQLRSFVGKPLQLTDLEKELTQISGCGLYESLRYEMIFKEEKPVLLITVVEKNYGPPFISFSLQANWDGADYRDLTAGFRSTAYNLTGGHSELRTDIGIGSLPYFATEFYQPLGNSQWFLAPSLKLEQTDGSLFENGNRLQSYKVINGDIGLDAGLTLNKYAELRLGYQIGHQRLRTTVGNYLDLGDLSGSVRKTELKFTYMNADETVGRSFFGMLKSNWYDAAPGASEPFGTVEASLRWSNPLGGHDILVAALAGGSSFEGDLPLVQKFKLGGPLQLGTYQFQELQGNHYLLGTIGYLRYLRKLPLTRKSLYLGTFVERGGAFAEWSDPQLHTDLSIGLVSPTVFGTLYIGTSFGKGTNHGLNLLLGHRF